MNKKNVLSLLIKELRWLLILVPAITFLFPVIGQADEETLNFYVTPDFPDSQIEGSTSYFDLNLSAGETEILILSLQNASSEDIKIQITPHTAYTNVHGVVEYGKDTLETDPSLSYSLDTLIESPEVIELSGNETKVIEIPLHMPQKSFEGFLAGGLRVSEVKDQEKEETNMSREGVAIKNEFAYVIGIVVSNSRNAVQPDLELLDVFADQLNYRNVISATIQNFTPTFVNQLAVEAIVTRVGEKNVLYETNKEMMQMAPNSHFHFPIPLDGERFQAGDYVLNLKAVSGEEEWHWERTFTIETEEARSLNRTDVTINDNIDWLLVMMISFIIILLIVILWMFVRDKKR